MSTFNPPHFALFPSPGMGHLTPFFHLSSIFLSSNCILTLITPHTTLSSAESNSISSFLAAHPQTRHLTFDILPPAPSGADPFSVQYDATSRSVDRVLPQLSYASPPVSAVFCDLLMTRGVAAVCKKILVPFYTVITTSARFFSFILHLPVLASLPDDKLKTSQDQVEIPGLPSLPLSSIPLPFLNPKHLLGATMVRSVAAISEARGILVNTFEWFEQKTLNALNSGKVSSNLPPVLAVGPLKAYELEKDQTECMQWLDLQPMSSVVYISFGSRTAMSSDQIRELRNGVERSGCRFLWVLKTTIVDKEEKEEAKDILGDSFLEKTKRRGLVVKGWVNQPEVLAHKAIGGFVSHCGWNSVMEAAERGVAVLAWPQHGDQRVNAEIVKEGGLGIWERKWGLELVKEEEIGKKMKELMEDEEVKGGGKAVGDEARKAIKEGGTSQEAISSVITKLVG